MKPVQRGYWPFVIAALVFGGLRLASTHWRDAFGGRGLRAHSLSESARGEDVTLARQKMALGRTWIARVKAVKSGPGVLVCEPVCVGVADGMIPFGAGCGRWLNLVVGGHGELGATPSWTAIEFSRRELSRPDLRLRPQDLATLARRAGARRGLTHVALGTLRDSGGKYRLTYQWWEIAARKAVGRPLTVSGSAEQIVAGLPEIARALCRAQRISAPRIPVSVGESVVDLHVLGKVPWADTSERAGRDEQLGRILTCFQPRSDGKNLPLLLAHFTAFRYAARSGAPVEADRQRDALLRLAPDNALVRAELGLAVLGANGSGISSLPVADVSRHVRQFPNSYLFRVAQACAHGRAGRTEAARRSAEMAVSCAPRDPGAWLFLSRRIDAQANAVRKGRFVGELTEKQMGYCTARYEEQIPVVLKAVQLDPRWFASWDELSAVAAFSSDEQVAHASFQKALSLSRGDPSVIRWGLQLYQPKWLGDRKELERVARTAASAAGGWSPGDRILTAYHVSCAGLTDRWQAVVRTPWERAAVQQTIDQDARGSRT